MLLLGFVFKRLIISTISGMIWGALKSMFLEAFAGLGTGGGLLSTLGNLVGSFFGSIFGKLFVVAAIADAAINVSEAINKFGDDLQAQGFDPATAKIAAGTTGLINTLTFGLLPPDIQMQIATAIAELADTLFKQLDEWFGPGFSDSLKNYMSGFLDMFAGFGDLLTSMWNGDSEGVNTALDKIVNGFFDMWVGLFEEAANIILKIGPIILEYVFMALSWLSNKIGDIFLSLKDIPVVGFIFEWMGNMFKNLGTAFDELSKWFGEVADYFKGINITAEIEAIGKSISDFFTSVGEGASTILEYITLPFRLAYHIIKTVIEAIYEEIIQPIASWIYDNVVKPVVDFLAEMWNTASDIMNSIWNNVIKPVFDAISSAAETVYDAISGAFQKAWSYIEPIFTYIKDTFLGVVTAIKEKGEALIDILSDPHTKAWDRIKNAFGFLYDEVKALPGKISEFLSGLSEKISAPFKDAWDWVKENFSVEKFKEIGNQIIDGVLDSLGSLKDKMSEKFDEAVEGVKETLGIASPSKEFSDIGGNLVTGLMDSLADIPEKISEQAGKVIESFTGIFDSIGDKITTAMENSLDKILESVQKVIDKLIKFFDKNIPKIVDTVDKNFTKITDSVSENFDKVFEVVEKITNKLLKFMEDNVPRGIKVFEDLRDGILNLFGLDSFGKIFDGIIQGLMGSLGTIADSAPFKAVIAIAQEVFKTHSPSKVFEDIGNNIVDGMDNSLENLPTVAEKHLDKTRSAAEEIGKIPTVRTKGATAAAAAATNAVGQDLLNAVSATEQMVAAAERIEKALEQGAKLNIDAKLQAFATKFGKTVGKGGAYTVKSKDVNINVNFKIAIDSQELERIMVTNGKSVIKQRINLLLSAIQSDHTTSKNAIDASATAKLQTGANPSDIGGYD